ncbi:MAG: hypothetical protein R3227_02875 [Reinekea sp.]|nr:hypothetical protein [Reinekea sp.]
MPNPTAALDPHSISQGNIQACSDLVFGTPTGDAVTITSAGSNIPPLKNREYFEIRNHPQATNNGLYRVDDTTPATGSIDVRKVSGSDPVVDSTGRNVDFLCTLETPGTTLTDAVFANASGSTVDITSAGGNLPTLFIGSRFWVENHSDAVNNGGYEVLSTVTNGYNCQKLTGSDPVDEAVSEAMDVYSEQKSYFYDVAADGLYVLEQPGLVSTAVSDAVWGTPSGATVGVTSAGSNLPIVKVGQKVQVFDHATAANNGDYVVRAVTTVGSDWTLEMVSDGKTPASAVSDAITILTDPLVDDTGVFGQPLYSRLMIDWNDDNYLRNNSGFPMFNIDSDAGKYLVGQNAAGVNTGADFVDNTEFGVRSRKLVRNMGWQSIDTNGNVKQEYAAIRSNASVEDNDRDVTYYQFGTNTAVDDTVDLEIAGPADESILCYDATVTRAQATATEGYDFNNAGDTIDRNDGGSFITDGYKVGGRVIVENAETSADNGTYLISTVAAGTLGVTTLTGGAVTFSDTLDDNTATLTIDNRFAFSLKLRPRDDDTLGKSFAQAGLADALATQLSNRAFVFGVGCVEDQNITNTDAVVSAYGVTIGFYSTPQSKGGATLVGGARNFGIVVDGNGKTALEIYEAIQYLLRQPTDIDSQGTNIGRTLDGLVRFNGSVLEFGSVDGGLSFPNNPEGGGSGVYCDNVAAADANNVKFWDNLGVLRSNKETIAVTLDANETLNNDTVSVMDLWFDRTIRTPSTTLTDLVINSAGTFTSAGANLPTLDEGDGAYVRVSGLTGDDEAMNGVYQVTAETSTSSWNVTRYDGATIVTTSAAGADLDEHPYDTPSALVVNTANLLTATTISFTSPDTIGDTGSGLAIFSVGDRLRIEGAGAGTNAGKIVKVATVVAGTITIEQNQFEPTLDTQAAGGSVTLTQIASIAGTTDFAFSFGFDDNTQGGRSVSTPAFVKAKAIGRQTAQFTESSVLSITSGTPLTVPLQAQQERNVTGVS